MNKFLLSAKQLQQFLRQYFECLFWITALALLFFMQVDNDAASLCMFRWLNIHSCPGCGIGHAIHDALHLQLATSFHHHPLGIAAVFIIANRIKQLSLTPKLKIQ